MVKDAGHVSIRFETNPIVLLYNALHSTTKVKIVFGS